MSADEHRALRLYVCGLLFGALLGFAVFGLVGAIRCSARCPDGKLAAFGVDGCECSGCP